MNFIQTKFCGTIPNSKYNIISFSLYYDEKLGRWVDPNADPNEANELNTKPPPMDIHLSSSGNNGPKQTISSGGLSAPPAPNSGNKYSAGIYTT